MFSKSSLVKMNYLQKRKSKYWEKKKKSRRKTPVGRINLSKSDCVGNFSWFCFLSTGVDFLHLLWAIYRLWCPSWPGGTSYPLLTQDPAFLLTVLTSCFSVSDDESVLVFPFTQHSVVVDIIGLGFKEFHRETESDVTLWQCPSDPLYIMCQRGWSGNHLAAPMATL